MNSNNILVMVMILLGVLFLMFILPEVLGIFENGANNPFGS